MLIEKCAYNLTYNYHDVSYINCTAVFDIGDRSQTRLTLFLNYCHFRFLNKYTFFFFFIAKYKSTTIKTLHIHHNSKHNFNDWSAAWITKKKSQKILPHIYWNFYMNYLLFILFKSKSLDQNKYLWKIQLNLLAFHKLIFLLQHYLITRCIII